MFLRIKRIFVVTFMLLFILPLQIQAATLYMEPVNKSIGPDDIFEVKVKVGVSRGEECINVAKIGLSFSPDVLEMKDFNSGESIFSLWVDKPDRDKLEQINKDGKIYFTGGVPGGYCGKIPGDLGDSNILGTIIFAVKKPIIFHKTNVDFLSDSEVLLNDGEGSAAEIKTQDTFLEIDENKTSVDNVWEEKIADDLTPPEPFVIEVNKAPNVFDNKYFVIFFTVDKQTGVDHYEVLEENPVKVLKALSEDGPIMSKIKSILGIQKLELSWKKMDSPYLLKDQNLGNVVMVKAVDNAGNERLAELQNDALDGLKNSGNDYLFIFIVILLVAVFSIILFMVMKKKEDDIDTL